MSMPGVIFDLLCAAQGVRRAASDWPNTNILRSLNAVSFSQLDRLLPARRLSILC